MEARAGSCSEGGSNATTGSFRCRATPLARNSACSHAAISGSKGVITWGGRLRHRHVEAAMPQLLGHFESDVTAAHHDGAATLAILRPRHDAFHVGDVAHHEMVRALDAGDGRPQRRCARGKNQRVVGLLVFAAGFQLAHPDAPGGAIDADDLGFDAHIQIEARLEALGRLHQQAVLLGDFTADEIRQSAVGKRHMRAALEDDDLAVLAQPPRACRRAGPAGDAADDDKTFFAHAFHISQLNHSHTLLSLSVADDQDKTQAQRGAGNGRAQ